MNINFAEFDKIPALRAKRNALDEAIESESEVVKVAFRQSRNEALAIIDRIDEVFNKRRESGKRLARYESPHWYESQLTYLIVAAVLVTIGASERWLLGLGVVLGLFGIGLHFRNLMMSNHYEREWDDADYEFERLELRWRSLGNISTIHFCILHDEDKRLDALRPIPDRKTYIEVWSHIANQWLNAERTILNALTQRHSPCDDGWRTELDEAEEDYLEKIKTLTR